MEWGVRDEDDDEVASRIVASVFGSDPDFGTGLASPNGRRLPPRLLSDELVAEITKQAREIGLL